MTTTFALCLILPIIVSAAPADDVKIDWKEVPDGTYSMGSNAGDEGPIHAVAVAAFQMSRNPVTRRQYEACVDAGACAPAHCRAGRDDQPVTCVSWNQAAAFCAWLGGRLPSEAEWEYTARISGGAALTAWEWVEDRYHPSYADAPKDASAWEISDGTDRVLRAGPSTLRFYKDEHEWSRDVSFHVARTAAAPKKPSEKITRSSASVEWVRVPGGTFTMGSGTGDEAPVHRVSIRAFDIARTLVTNRQYRSCVVAGACLPPEKWCLDDYPRDDDQPVVCVTWDQAKAFSEWAGGRLPSEAEWEYAARSAGKDRKYPWGDEPATCGRAIILEGGIAGCGQDAAWPVCSKPAGNTEQGLCDMAGNVWQWVQDWYHPTYDGSPDDGSAWEIPLGSERVLRGSSGVNPAFYTRVTHRGMSRGRANLHSFRPARSIP